MKTFSIQKTVTYLSLFALLFARFPIADFVFLLEKLFGSSVFYFDPESLRLLQNQSVQLLYGYSFILVAIVILVNRSHLDRLNIDKWFLLIFLGGGLAYSQDSGWLVELITTLVTFFVFVLGVRGGFKFGDKEPDLRRIMLILVVGFFLGILFVASTINFIKVRWIIQWFLEDIPVVVVEEMVFRGMLWMFLKDLNFSEVKIVVLQSILFWISHVYAANNLIFFWIITPIVSVLLGIITWRSKSITPSATAHILFNLLLGLIETRNL